MSESKRERYIRLLKSKADLNFVELTFDAVKEIIELLEETSAEPEIIRCKDCKWFGEAGCAVMIVDDLDKPTEDDYCSFAERKEECTP